ncbi:MAG: helix-turn-helix domain-containing protein [Deltaproteobacteria bacterium]
MQQGNVMAEDQIIENGFWDIADLSSYLKVKVKTIYAMTSGIPHYRVGKLIRFRKQEIDSWMESNRGKAFDGINKSKNIKIKNTDKGNIIIDKLIRKAIDQSNKEVYNPNHGKSDRIEGLIKEIKNGSI